MKAYVYFKMQRNALKLDITTGGIQREACRNLKVELTMLPPSVLNHIAIIIFVSLRQKRSLSTENEIILHSYKMKKIPQEL